MSNSIPLGRAAAFSLLVLCANTAGAGAAEQAAALPLLDLKTCVQTASPQWKEASINVLIQFDGKAFSVLLCRTYDSLRTDGSSSYDPHSAPPGTYDGRTPGWELWGADGKVLYRKSLDFRESCMCQRLEAPPPRGGGHFANVAQAGGTFSQSIPLVPGATTLVIYDAPCGETPNKPVARVSLR